MNQNPNTSMTAPVSNGANEIALNKPNLFNGDREKLKEFLQSVEVYMDVNHEVHISKQSDQNCLRVIVHEQQTSHNLEVPVHR